MSDAIGVWTGPERDATFDPDALPALAREIRRPAHVVREPAGSRLGLALGGTLAPGAAAGLPCMASLSPLGPGSLGDGRFREDHGLAYAYVGGGMARGISSAALVTALARNGMMGFFGAAGLAVTAVHEAIRTIRDGLEPSGEPWGVNLIHTPDQPALEDRLVDLFLAEGVRRVEAAAFLGLTPAIVRFACTGLGRDGAGAIVRRNHVIAKVSRPEVARHFLAPPPAAMLAGLVGDGALTRAEAELAARLTVASAVTVEADSGGHTDNRPLGPAFSAICALAGQLAREHDLASGAHLGVAGGLGTPRSIASAFALGAAYVCLGSVHQACVESGTSGRVKEMLAQAGLADFAMTSSADMFEQGMRVQVLKRGTMMPQRGNHLHGLYVRCASIDDLTEAERTNLERNVFKKTLDEVWKETQEFFGDVDPSQIRLAQRDARKKLALVFRWYLGKSSQWALAGVEEHRLDYQVWCGPAMGAFNEWTRGTPLARPENRAIATVARQLLEGAAVVTRAHQLRCLGVPLPAAAFSYEPGMGTEPV